MSASLRVESGISAGTSYWIDRPVLRIGGDPQCEICLPMSDLAPHALTLEFRDGSYRAYNRSSSPVTIGKAVVQPGAIGIWGEDQAAQLAGGLRLVLEIDGDPRPCPRPEARIDDDFSHVNHAALPDAASPAISGAEKKKSSSTLMQLGVIGFCMLAMAAFLTMGPGEDPVAAQRPTFDGIVEVSLKKSKDDAARLLLPRLQYAQSALIRGNTQQARTRFLKLRDQLVRQIESLPADGREDSQRMLDYVEYRLGQLQP